jgi:hypothetical protein
VIVAAEAFGEAQEHRLLEVIVAKTRENFEAIGTEEKVFQRKVFQSTCTTLLSMIQLKKA